MFSSLFRLWKGSVGQSRDWMILNNTSETTKVFQLHWAFNKLRSLYFETSLLFIFLLYRHRSSSWFKLKLEVKSRLCVLFFFKKTIVCKLMLYFLKIYIFVGKASFDMHKVLDEINLQ